MITPTIAPMMSRMIRQPSRADDVSPDVLLGAVPLLLVLGEEADDAAAVPPKPANVTDG